MTATANEDYSVFDKILTTTAGVFDSYFSSKNATTSAETTNAILEAQMKKSEETNAMLLKVGLGVAVGVLAIGGLYLIFK